MKDQNLLDLEAIMRENKGSELTDEALSKVAGGMNVHTEGTTFAVKCVACNEIVSEWYETDVLPNNTVILMRTARISCPKCGVKGDFVAVNDVEYAESQKI